MRRTQQGQQAVLPHLPARCLVATQMRPRTEVAVRSQAHCRREEPLLTWGRWTWDAKGQGRGKEVTVASQQSSFLKAFAPGRFLAKQSKVPLKCVQAAWTMVTWPQEAEAKGQQRRWGGGPGEVSDESSPGVWNLEIAQAAVCSHVPACAHTGRAHACLWTRAPCAQACWTRLHTCPCALVYRSPCAHVPSSA